MSGAAARRDALVAPVAIVGVAILAWPFPAVVPGVGLDWSWVAGLETATWRGLDFGSEVIWTYGPLGALELGALVYYGELARVALAYQWLLQLLLAATAFLAARRSYPDAVALALAFVVVAFVPERGLALGFAWCALALTDGDEADALAKAMRWLPVAVGVLTGILLLGKLNHGTTMLALATIALTARPGARARDGLVFAAALLGAAALGWLATGQAVDGAWAYARTGSEVIAGYAAALGIGPDTEWRYVTALLVTALASLVLGGAAHRLDPAPRWGLLALCAVFAFASFKAGFVRADGHMSIFSGNLLILLAVLPARGTYRPLALAGLATCLAVFLTIPNFYARHERILNPVGTVRDAFTQARTVLAADRGNRARAELVEATRAHYSLPFAGSIGAQTVAFWPGSHGDLAYAYRLRWRPLPVLEAYAAYTPTLDAAGARMLASGRAPRRIVRRLGSVADGLQAPATGRELFCRYRELGREGEWQLLSRGRDVCGAERPLEVIAAGWSEAVEVPPARRGDAALVLRVHGAEPAGLERLQDLLLRPAPRYAQLDDQPHRVVAATLPDGLLLKVPARLDYRPPFAFAPAPATIAISRDGGQPAGELRYEFSEVPLTPLSKAPVNRRG